MLFAPRLFAALHMLLARPVDSLPRRSLDAIEGEADIPRTRWTCCSDVFEA
jgi:hypothetical protein